MLIEESILYWAATEATYRLAVGFFGGVAQEDVGLLVGLGVKVLVVAVVGNHICSRLLS